MIKILIADERKTIREGIKHIISNCSDMEVIGEANDAEETVYLNWRFDYDVVLLEENIPSEFDQDTISLLKKERPGLAILLLSLDPRNNRGDYFIEKGVSGNITSEFTPKELIDTIRAIYKN